VKTLLATALGLLGLGLLSLYSLLGAAAGRQLAYALLGIGMMLGLSRLQYGRWKTLGPWAYGLAVGCLGLVLIPGFGHAANGAQRWVRLGPLGTFQPSELAKLGLILFLARLLERGPKISGLRMLAALGFMSAPFLLTLLQPDLGTACVLLAITLGMLFVAGASPVYLSGLVVGGLAVLPHILKPYQRDRLMVFLNPEHDAMGAGYNLLQSKTAIGSGGIWGSGLTRGLLSQHGFVPENHTDFIITAVGEELGLLGCLGILLLFALLLALVWRVASRASSRFGALLASGTLIMLGFQAVINLGMATGLVPAVGIPLPFISHGGTSLLVNFAALGVVANISRHQRGKRVTGRDLPLQPWEPAGPIA
jgi:rod shape determining protein RodA